MVSLVDNTDSVIRNAFRIILTTNREFLIFNRLADPKISEIFIDLCQRNLSGILFKTLLPTLWLLFESQMLMDPHLSQQHKTILQL